MEPPLTVKEVAAYFGVRESTVRHWARRRFLPAMRRNGRFWFQAAEVARFERLRRHLEAQRRRW